MIDRERVKAKAAQGGGARYDAGIGDDKPWHKSWRVLMDLATCQTNKEFVRLSPKFERAMKDFQVWARKLKRNPNGQDAAPGFENWFHDLEFARALENLTRAVQQFRILNGEDGEIGASAETEEIRKKLWRLSQECAGYVS